jgi:hypothetical protein
MDDVTCSFLDYRTLIPQVHSQRHKEIPSNAIAAIGAFALTSHLAEIAAAMRRN